MQTPKVFGPLSGKWFCFRWRRFETCSWFCFSWRRFETCSRSYLPVLLTGRWDRLQVSKSRHLKQKPLPLTDPKAFSFTRIAAKAWIQVWSHLLQWIVRRHVCIRPTWHCIVRTGLNVVRHNISLQGRKNVSRGWNSSELVTTGRS
jgi:hypothetical protein